MNHLNFFVGVYKGGKTKFSYVAMLHSKINFKIFMITLNFDNLSSKEVVVVKMMNNFIGLLFCLRNFQNISGKLFRFI
jgi:hypothetical protein